MSEITPERPAADASGRGTDPEEQERQDQEREDQLAALEAVLMVLDAPASIDELAAALEWAPVRVDELIHQLRADYDGLAPNGARTGRARGFELRGVGGGWRIAARAEHAEAVSRLVLGGQTTRLSQAALETLAVIAYRQPVSRARIAAIRGVNAEGVVRTLQARGLVVQSGVDNETGASLFGTTPAFLERLGIDSLGELPPLSPLLPGVEHLDEIIGNE